MEDWRDANAVFFRIIQSIDPSSAHVVIIYFNVFLYSAAFDKELEAVVRRCSVNKVFSQNSQESTCTKVSFLKKLDASACNFIKKETLVQGFSYEFCEILKKTFFIEHFR